MAAAAAGHGFFYPSMWGNSPGAGSFGNSTTGSSNGGAAINSTTIVSQMPNVSTITTSNSKENCDRNSFEPPHASPPDSANPSSSPYGYPSSPSKCDVKSVAHSIKLEHNLSNRNEGSESLANHYSKSLATTRSSEYSSRAEDSPSEGFSPTHNNNHLNSDKDELSNAAAPITENGGYDNINRHHSYPYHHQDTSNNNSCSATYNGHSLSGSGNSSTSGHLMKRPEGTNRTNTTGKREKRDIDNGCFSPPPDNGLPPHLLYNSSSITSSVGGYPYLGSAHQSSNHHQNSLSSPLYGSYSTCGSLFASPKSFQTSSSSKSRSIKTKASSTGKKLENLVCAAWCEIGGSYNLTNE